MGNAALQNGFPGARHLPQPRTSPATIIRGPWNRTFGVPVRAPLPQPRLPGPFAYSMPWLLLAAAIGSEIRRYDEWKKEQEANRQFVQDSIVPVQQAGFVGYTKSFDCFQGYDVACYSNGIPAQPSACTTSIIQQIWPVAACSFATAVPLSGVTGNFTTYSAPQQVGSFARSYPIAAWVLNPGASAPPVQKGVTFIQEAPLADAVATWLNPLLQPMFTPISPWVPRYNLRPRKLRAPRRGYVETSDTGYSPQEPNSPPSAQGRRSAGVSASGSSSSMGRRPPAHTREVKGAIGRNMSAILRFGRAIMGTFYAWDTIDDAVDALYGALPASLRYGKNKLVPPRRGMSKLEFQLWQNGEKARVIANNLSSVNVDKFIELYIANQFSELQSRSATLRSSPAASFDGGHWYKNDAGNWTYDPFD